ncbi:hypothetical protein JJ691_22760 [Kutzneria sp. CA-103260]|nr:hypothetical protein JJ691_22760 [Kutzneria sp. CA-103260]
MLLVAWLGVRTALGGLLGTTSTSFATCCGRSRRRCVRWSAAGSTSPTATTSWPRAWNWTAISRALAGCCAAPTPAATAPDGLSDVLVGAGEDAVPVPGERVPPREVRDLGGDRVTRCVVGRGERSPRARRGIVGRHAVQRRGVDSLCRRRNREFHREHAVDGVGRVGDQLHGRAGGLHVGPRTCGSAGVIRAYRRTCGHGARRNDQVGAATEIDGGGRPRADGDGRGFRGRCRSSRGRACH